MIWICPETISYEHDITNPMLEKLHYYPITCGTPECSVGFFFLSLIRQANDTTPTAAQIIIIDFIIHHLTIKVVASMDCKDIQIASSYRGAIKWRNLHTRDGRAIWRNEQEPTGRWRRRKNPSDEYFQCLQATVNDVGVCLL